MTHLQRRKKLRKQRQASTIKKVLGISASLIVLAIVIFAIVALTSLSSLANLKPAKITNQPQRSIVYAADGGVIGSFYVQNREAVSLSRVPRYMRDAVVAVEDRRFYQHRGVDIEAITRAFVQNLTKRRVAEGGSTLTQQYVKNALTGDEVSFSRKLKEAYLAIELERHYSKSQILEAYINTVYFGHGAYGVEAAAETYFGKRVQDLTLAEAAIIAGLPKSPEGFSPYESPAEAKRRQADVLDKMVSEKYITKAQAQTARTQQLAYKSPAYEDVNSKVAPYFVEYVKQQLLHKYGKDKVFGGGLKIYTTLDPKMQKNADTVVRTTLDREGNPTASIVAVDPKTGYVKTMAVGKDFKTFQYNIATQGRRQPGSSFKIFTLVAALEKGISPQTIYNGSGPIQIRIPNSNEVWTVNNAESGVGAMTLWDATVHSINAVYAQLVMQVSPETVVETAKRMGIESKLDPYPSIAIGGLTTGVSPLEMASAYGTLATGGEHSKIIAVTKVVDRNGRILWDNKPTRKRAVDAKIAGQTTQMLQDVIRRGTGTAAQINRPEAGKTGTAENYQDAWFVGYTPDLSTAVWMGYAEGQISMRDVNGTGPAFGGVIPAAMWHDFMTEALKDVPPHDFPSFETPKTEPPRNQPPATATTPPSSTSTTAPIITAPTTTAPTATAPTTTAPPTTQAPPPTTPPTTAPPTTAPPTTTPPPPPPPTTSKPP